MTRAPARRASSPRPSLKHITFEDFQQCDRRNREMGYKGWWGDLTDLYNLCKSTNADLSITFLEDEGILEFTISTQDGRGVFAHNVKAPHMTTSSAALLLNDCVFSASCLDAQHLQ